MDNWCWWRVSYLNSVNIISCFFNKRIFLFLSKFILYWEKKKSYNFKINNVNQHCITIKTRKIMKKRKKKKNNINDEYCHILSYTTKKICTRNIHYYWIDLIKSILEATKTYFVPFVGEIIWFFRIWAKINWTSVNSFDFWGQQDEQFGFFNFEPPLSSEYLLGTQSSNKSLCVASNQIDQ